MSGIRARLGLAAALLVSVVAFACGHDGTSDPGTSPSGINGSAAGGSTSGGSSGGGATGGGATGTLTIKLTDSPFSEAKALLVSFSEVSVHRANPGEWKTLPFTAWTPRTCDLTRLQGVTDILGVGPLPEGKYTQIRLQVSSADLYFDEPSSGPACAPTPHGKSAPVTIPSGEVKLNNEFTLTSPGSTIVLDFDADRSVHQTGSGNGNGNGNGRGNSNGNGGTTGRYMMSPVIRVVSVQ